MESVKSDPDGHVNFQIDTNNSTPLNNALQPYRGAVATHNPSSTQGNSNELSSNTNSSYLPPTGDAQNHSSALVVQEPGNQVAPTQVMPPNPLPEYVLSAYTALYEDHQKLKDLFDRGRIAYENMHHQLQASQQECAKYKKDIANMEANYKNLKNSWVEYKDANEAYRITHIADRSKISGQETLLNDFAAKAMKAEQNAVATMELYNKMSQEKASLQSRHDSVGRLLDEVQARHKAEVGGLQKQVLKLQTEVEQANNRAVTSHNWYKVLLVTGKPPLPLPPHLDHLNARNPPNSILLIDGVSYYASGPSKDNNRSPAAGSSSQRFNYPTQSGPGPSTVEHRSQAQPQNSQPPLQVSVRNVTHSNSAGQVDSRSPSNSTRPHYVHPSILQSQMVNTIAHRTSQLSPSADQVSPTSAVPQRQHSSSNAAASLTQLPSPVSAGPASLPFPNHPPPLVHPTSTSAGGTDRPNSQGNHTARSSLTVGNPSPSSGRPPIPFVQEVGSNRQGAALTPRRPSISGTVPDSSRRMSMPSPLSTMSPPMNNQSTSALMPSTLMQNSAARASMSHATLEPGAQGQRHGDRRQSMPTVTSYTQPTSSAVVQSNATTSSSSSRPLTQIAPRPQTQSPVVPPPNFSSNPYIPNPDGFGANSSYFPNAPVIPQSNGQTSIPSTIPDKHTAPPPPPPPPSASIEPAQVVPPVPVGLPPNLTELERAILALIPRPSQVNPFDIIITTQSARASPSPVTPSASSLASSKRLRGANDDEGQSAAKRTRVGEDSAVRALDDEVDMLEDDEVKPLVAQTTLNGQTPGSDDPKQATPGPIAVATSDDQANHPTAPAQAENSEVQLQPPAELDPVPAPPRPSTPSKTPGPSAPLTSIIPFTPTQPPVVTAPSNQETESEGNLNTPVINTTNPRRSSNASEKTIVIHDQGSDMELDSDTERSRTARRTGMVFSPQSHVVAEMVSGDEGHSSSGARNTAEPQVVQTLAPVLETNKKCQTPTAIAERDADVPDATLNKAEAQPNQPVKQEQELNSAPSSSFTQHIPPQLLSLLKTIFRLRNEDGLIFCTLCSRRHEKLRKQRVQAGSSSTLGLPPVPTFGSSPDPSVLAEHCKIFHNRAYNVELYGEDTTKYEPPTTVKQRSTSSH